MKILSLNTWHGTCGPVLKNYLSSQLQEIDVFCFQETNGDEIQQILFDLFTETDYSYTTATKTTDAERHYSLHTFVKKPLHIASSTPLFENSDSDTGQSLATIINDDDGASVVVVNVHGVPFKVDDKLDTEGRLRQTETIISWVHGNSPGSAVVCGDFNLLPEAKSVTNFEAAGFRNLISDYEIQTTRNKLAWDRFPDNMQYFADYTFTTSELKVNSFEVPANEVSDHLPIIVEIAS